MPNTYVHLFTILIVYQSTTFMGSLNQLGSWGHVGGPPKVNYTDIIKEKQEVNFSTTNG